MNQMKEEFRENVDNKGSEQNRDRQERESDKESEGELNIVQLKNEKVINEFMIHNILYTFQYKQDSIFNQQQYLLENIE